MDKIKLRIAFLLTATISFAQQKVNSITVGHEFNIETPNYFVKAQDLADNCIAKYQFKSDVKELYGYVIAETKEDLNYKDLKFSTVEEFQELALKDFIGKDKMNVLSPISYKNGYSNISYTFLDMYDKKAKVEIGYLFGFIETDKAFYKILLYTTKDKIKLYEEDFKAIMNSIKD